MQKSAYGRKRRKVLKQISAFVCMLAVTITGIPLNGLTVQAATEEELRAIGNVLLDNGGYKDGAVTDPLGVGTDDWGKTYKPRTETLPPATTYLTDNYRETVGTVPTSDWASSVVFDQYSEVLYAHPLAFRAASNGMQMAYPAVTDATSYVDGEPLVESLLKDETVELVVGADGFTAKDARVDKTTDWTYDILLENSAGTSSMMATLAKGTPYAYYTFDNLSPTISLGEGATDLAIYKNNSNILGISLKNNKDGKTHYYGVYAPSGTTWTNAGGKLTANLPAGKSYLSIAVLPDNTDATFRIYQQYAFNFITDTVVEWEYHENASKVYTRYNVTTTNMETGATGGDTIIALYPHQWRYLYDGSLTGYTYDTIRGTMKTLIGSSYITEMQYNGILSTLPVTTNETYLGDIKNQLGYLYSYRKDKADPKWIAFLEGQYGGYDTYWVGKNLNTMADAIFLADQFPNDADMVTMKNEMVAGVANYLQFWFNPAEMYINGSTVDSYFYYHEDYGTLIGYPASYTSDKEVNDHHFHYGYWIKAAAAIAQNDPNWANEWGAMVYEMISDIANTNRDGSSYNANSPAKYPFLRNFDIYEGHSWASGVANYEYDAEGNMIDSKGGLSGGNNQESSSESVNAWASLILWGEAVGDTRIRDLGVYLYTTEIAAVEDYYYDVHNEIFTDAYEDNDNYNLETVTRLFGGRYDHTAWWTENSIEVTTITMLPLSGATLYMGKYPEKVKAVADSINETSTQWTHFVATKDQSCANFGKTDMLIDPKTNQDVVAMYYAYYDAEEAFNMWDRTDSGKVENGESRAHTYAYITSLMEYGTQNFDITGSSPLSLVLEKDGVKTYIAENHTDEAQRVYFSDGTYIDVPANSTYEGAKTGDGENPNVDDTEILGAQKKFNLEVYCKKLDGSGYDMTSRVVRAKTDANTYTYVPEEITGFTYDSGNVNNVLTVDVTEGNVETVKVYYNRNSYTILYNLNGGTLSGSNPTSYTYGETKNLISPTLSGYEFLGWYQNSQLTGSPLTSITATTAGNLMLYAGWRKEGAVTGVSLDITATKLKTGDSVTLTATIEPNNAKDKSVTWTSSNPAVATVSDTGVVAAAAEGTATITVKTNDGNYTANCDITVSDYVYTRGEKGVEIDEDGNLIIYVTNTSNAAVVAYYNFFSTQAEAEAVVLHNLPGYNMTKTDSGAFEYSVANPDQSQYLAYAFNGGIQETPVVIAVKDIPKVGSGSADDGGGTGTNPVTAAYKVEHYQQNETLDGYVLVKTDTMTGTIGDTVTAIDADYTGFTWNASAAGTVASGVVVSDGSLVLKLYYNREIYDYTYVYNDNTTADKTAQYVYGVGIKTLEMPTRSGYVFKGWYTDEALTTQVTAISTSQTGAVKLYARWVLAVEDDSVTYAGRGVAYQDGKLTFYVADPAEGVTGVSAYYRVYDTEEEALEKKDAVDTTTWKRVTLTYDATTGCWFGTKDVELGMNSYLVYSFYFNGGEEDGLGDTSVLSQQIITSGQLALELYVVMYYKQRADKSGYEEIGSATCWGIVGATVSASARNYVGFTVNKDAENSLTSGKVSSSAPLVLRMYYDRDEYAINYNLNGGTQNAANPVTYTYGGESIVLSAPTRSGYVFAGWYEDASYSLPITAISTNQTASVNLYAKWTPATTTGNTVKPVTTKAANPLLQTTTAYTKVVGSKKFTLQTKAQGTVTYKSSNKKVATVGKTNGKVTIKGTGKTVITVTASGNEYYNAATIKITLQVTPKKVNLKSVKSLKTSTAVVTWKRDKKATGYEVQYTTDAKFKKAKTVKVKKNAITITTLKKLKAGKKYYVRVRAYKKSGGTVKGAWSKAKRVTVLK